MKTIGIACDNYKISKFEEELKALNLTNYLVTQLLTSTKLIRVFVEDKDFHEATNKVYKICVKLEINFKRSN